LAACVAVVALGAAWLAFSDRLSGRLTAEERQLVGKWQPGADASKSAAATLEFKADRQLHALYALPPAGNGGRIDSHWSIRAGKFHIDSEPRPIRRLVRPLAGLLGINVGSLASYPSISISENEFTSTDAKGTKYTWTRVRGE
jgi:hypothetical protein